MQLSSERAAPTSEPGFVKGANRGALLFVVSILWDPGVIYEASAAPQAVGVVNERYFVNSIAGLCPLFAVYLPSPRHLATTTSCFSTIGRAYISLPSLAINHSFLGLVELTYHFQPRYLSSLLDLHTFKKLPLPWL